MIFYNIAIGIFIMTKFPPKKPIKMNVCVKTSQISLFCMAKDI